MVLSYDLKSEIFLKKKNRRGLWLHICYCARRTHYHSLVKMGPYSLVVESAECLFVNVAEIYPNSVLMQCRLHSPCIFPGKVGGNYGYISLRFRACGWRSCREIYKCQIHTTIQEAKKKVHNRSNSKENRTILGSESFLFALSLFFGQRRFCHFSNIRITLTYAW